MRIRLTFVIAAGYFSSAQGGLEKYFYSDGVDDGVTD